MEITSIKLSLIDEDKEQPRYQFNEEALEELANSIREIGLLSPIKVRAMENGRYKIIYGNRRYKASMMVGLEAIPCIVSTASDEMDIYLEQIAENLTREDFSPIEEAEAFHKLMNDDRFRSSSKLLSSKLGKPESYIKNKLELLKFSSAVKKLIVSGTQIRKDCLTEDQLMPLKDLPLEFRDTLALTAARDELPVSDVKKIAKLFKDSSISDATKQKLLLKNGSSLIETWSVYEQNRKEKLAREKEQKERARKEEERKAEAQAAALQSGTADLGAIQPESSLAGGSAAVSSLAASSSTGGSAAVSSLAMSSSTGGSSASGSSDAPFTLSPENHSTADIHTADRSRNTLPLDKDQYAAALEQALQQADALLQALQSGVMQQHEACEQLAVDMLVKLEQLQQRWQTIQQTSRT